MKTKIFFSFLAVILLALVSNVIFHSMIRKDFEEYVRSAREDQLYWVMAAVEGSHEKGGWNRKNLKEALHWGLMLGMDIMVLDMDRKTVMQTKDVMTELQDSMHRRMMSVIDLADAKEEVEEYPLFIKGNEIGALRVREVRRMGNLAEKENIFRRRGREFLVMSFAIAGGGAVFLSVIFVLFLTRPILRLKDAAEEIAEGNFDVRVNISSNDEIGQLADSFNFMTEALKKEDEIRRHLTSNIAHELRTPLTIMKATLEGIVDEVVACTRDQAKNIKEEVERLIRLVEGIEDVTRAEASFLQQSAPERLNLREELQKQIGVLQHMAGEKGIKIEFSRDEDLFVVTDHGKLNTIVRNLLANALKYTDDGAITIDYGLDGEMFHISVSDTGHGISDDDREKIFNRFFKGPHSKGTGVGLAIVKELLRALKGDIEVRSVVGKGSTFTVRIPNSREKE